MLYMIFYYRLLGVVVLAGLAVTGALLWAIIAFMGQSLNTTIDLAGIIGIIVSIGITVDSYIVYFERLKDEARSGPDRPDQCGQGVRQRLPHGAGRRRRLPARRRRPLRLLDRCR